MVEGLLVGLAIGIVVGLLIGRLRPAGATTQTPMNTLASPTSALSAPAHEEPEQRGIHIRREVIKRRIETRLTPQGLTITIDGQEFHRLADVPDHVLADEVRERLTNLAKGVTDPAQRAALEKELRDAGIEPADQSFR